MSGIHMGLVTLINEKEWNDIVAVTIPSLLGTGGGGAYFVCPLAD